MTPNAHNPPTKAEVNMISRQTFLNFSAGALLTAAFTGAPTPSFADTPVPELPVQACATIPVYPFATMGWSQLDGTAPHFVDGPEGASGQGSLKFQVEDTFGRTDFFRTSLTPLSNATGLGYMFNTTSGSSANYALRILGARRTDGSLTGFTTLNWVPNRNGTTDPTNSWITASNIENGKWWSTQAIAGLPTRNDTLTLAEISRQNPNARVTNYGVNMGTGSTTSSTFVDNIQFACTTWDFEPLPSSGSAGSSGSSTGSGQGSSGSSIGSAQGSTGS